VICMVADEILKSGFIFEVELGMYSMLKSIFKNRHFSKDIVQYKNVLKSCYLGNKESQNSEILYPKHFVFLHVFLDNF